VDKSKHMSKEDMIEMTGMVNDVLPGNMFKVQIENTNHILICYLGGKLKQHKIRVIQGDKVKLETSPYDLNKGRITYRL
jgi:translation initiation factor IF-1